MPPHARGVAFLSPGAYVETAASRSENEQADALNLAAARSAEVPVFELWPQPPEHQSPARKGKEQHAESAGHGPADEGAERPSLPSTSQST
jgi:hypothetical protein